MDDRWRNSALLAGFALCAAASTVAQDFPARFDLGTLRPENGADGSLGLLLSASGEGESAGWDVASLGDVNGDGRDDLIIGAAFADPNGLRSAGRAYVVFGTATPLAELPLDSLDGSNGFIVEGFIESGNLASSVAGIGDVNGDGFRDIAIGAPFSAGTVFIVFGTDQGFPARVDPTGLDGTNGFSLQPRPEPFPQGALGQSVAGVGDFNGDGIDDFLAGAQLFTLPQGRIPGEAYLVFGSTAGFPAVLDLNSLNGTNGSILRPAGQVALATEGLAAGDFNGDGLADIMVSGGNDGGLDREAGVYILYGTEQPLTRFISLAELAAPEGAIFSDCDRDSFPVCDDDTGRSMAAADLNDDGFDDAIIGTSDRGEVFVWYGAADGFPSNMRVENLDGSNGFVFQLDPSGHGDAANVGDFNNDGIEDLLVSSEFSDVAGAPQAGRAYLLYGNRDGFPALLSWVRLDGENGFVLSGDVGGVTAGSDVASAGDFNHDGALDLLIGAYRSDRVATDAGEAFVVYGRPPGSDTAEDFEDFADGERPDADPVGVLAGEGLSIDCVFGAPDNDPRCASIVRFFPNARVRETDDAFGGTKALSLTVRQGNLFPPPQSYLVFEREAPPLGAQVVFDLQLDAVPAGLRRLTVDGSVNGVDYVALGSVDGPRDETFRGRITLPLTSDLDGASTLFLRLRAYSYDPALAGEDFAALIDNIDVVAP